MKDIKKRIFKIIQIGYMGDVASCAFDIVIAVTILLNLFVVFFETFDASKAYLGILGVVEFVTIVIFTIEYILRVFTSDLLYPNEKSKLRAALTFVFSFYGIVDLLSFLPYWLPVVFPTGLVAFRMLRIVRILRLFRINAYYDAFNVINDVIKQKRGQILSALFMIIMMVIASSLIMYNLEHEAQPQVFANAFSGIWWAVSTLLTVGYGDIYPVTLAGQIVAIVLAFLGVGLVAIPTGIISAGFVEQYTKIKRMSVASKSDPVDFLSIELKNNHDWIGKKITQIQIPMGMLVLAVIREDEVYTPKNDIVLASGDKVVLGDKELKDSNDFVLDAVGIRPNNPWIGKEVYELERDNDMRIVLIRRKDKNIIPSSEVIIQNQDEVVCYKKLTLS